MALELDFAGQTVIVTGAGRNIGRGISQRFAEAGANVVATARTKSQLEETVELVESYGVEGRAITADLASQTAIDHLVESAIDEFGSVAHLVNNAGVNPDQLDKEGGIPSMVDVNLEGVYWLSKAFFEAFVRTGPPTGSIVNISSIAAQVGITDFEPMYAGTKAGVYGLTRGFAADFASEQVRVNSVSPGFVLIPRTEQMLEEFGDELFEMDRIPLGRPTTPEAVGDACVFLASQLAADVTGVDLLVDGGVHFTAGLYK